MRKHEGDQPILETALCGSSNLDLNANNTVHAMNLIKIRCSHFIAIYVTFPLIKFYDITWNVNNKGINVCCNLILIE